MKKWTFWKIWKLMGDAEGWTWTRWTSEREVRHKKEKIDISLNFAAIIWEADTSTVWWKASFWQWPFLQLRAFSLKRKLKKRES